CGIIAAVGTVLAVRRHRRRERAALSKGVDAWIASQRKQLKEQRKGWKYLRFVGPIASLGTAALAIKSMMDGDARVVPLLWGCSALLAVGSVVLVHFFAAVDRELSFFGEEVAP